MKKIIIAIALAATTEAVYLDTKKPDWEKLMAEYPDAGG